jgi:hypothetical protein
MTPAIGFAIREQNRPVLSDPAINAAEITFERADDPLRVERYLGDLEFDIVSVHALKLSVGSPEPPGRQYLQALRAIAFENGARSISDHLGFTRDAHGGVEIGHFAPMPRTPAALDVACANIDRVQRALRPFDFYVENIACLFNFDGTMSEAEFLAEVLARTGCGLLLDITNVYANARNFGYDARAFISMVMPVPQRVQMHLAGGYWDDEAGLYIDSHSSAIPREVFDLYRFALELGRGKVEAVFIERDQEFPSSAGWRQEVRRARAIAEEVGSAP